MKTKNVKPAVTSGIPSKKLSPAEREAKEKKEGKSHFRLGFIKPIIALLIKWSGIAVTDGRGKAGGTVFSKGRSGAIARNKVTPVNRRTSFQMSIRSVLTFFSQAFRALSTDQINAWNNAATNGYSTTNIFGDIIKKSGLGLYCALNINLRTIGLPAISNPPVSSGVGNMVSIDPTADVSSTELFLNGLNFTGGSTVDANTTLVILACSPVSAGISFISSQMRIIGTIDTPDDTATTNLWTMYSDRFGAPAAGQKIFIGCTAVNKTTGQAGVPLKQGIIVSA